MQPEPNAPIPCRHRLTVRLTAGVTLALLLIGVPFLLAFHRLRRARQLDALAEATGALSRVIVDGLRSAMLAGHPDLLDDAIRNLSRDPEVERVILMDRSGRVRVSSDPLYEGRVFNRDGDGMCRVCHLSADVLPSSRASIATEKGRRVFRTVSTIR